MPDLPRGISRGMRAPLLVSPPRRRGGSFPSMLKVSDLSKRFPDGPVLERVSFVLNEGDKVGLVGANGSGKSTLLRVIAGELPPDGGAERRAGRARRDGGRAGGGAGGLRRGGGALRGARWLRGGAPRRDRARRP